MQGETKIWAKMIFKDDKHVDIFNSDGMACKAEE